MTGPDIQAINRAICEVEDQDIREKARTALHRVFRRQCRLEKQVTELKHALGAHE